MIPLERGDVEPLLELQGLLDEVYEQAGFDLTIDYAQVPIPGLSKEDQSWWRWGVVVGRFGRGWRALTDLGVIFWGGGGRSLFLGFLGR